MRKRSLRGKWENIEEHTRRLKVFGGWVVDVCEFKVGHAICFVPDCHHKWGL